jgi:hypothetical protein
MAFGEVGTSLSKIKANSLNLAGTFGFTGTVSGLADETPLVLISTFTSDGSDATASFTSGIDSTYKEYMFVFNSIHPETDAKRLGFQCSTDGGSSYGVTTTTTHFIGYHREDGSSSELSYKTANDLAQSTDFIQFEKCGNDNDQCLSGILKLYNPSSTTFVKHFLGVSSNAHEYPAALKANIGGYFNTTSAINAVQFKFDSGEIQGGTIDLFGVV